VGWTVGPADGSSDERVLLALVTSDAAEPNGVKLGAALIFPLGGVATGWESNLHLAASPLFPKGALISTWESAASASSLAAVDLKLDFRPSPFVFLK
jgi:hypothetical protein